MSSRAIHFARARATSDLIRIPLVGGGDLGGVFLMQCRTVP
jgi:hypothetical protein